MDGVSRAVAARHGEQIIFKPEAIVDARPPVGSRVSRCGGGAARDLTRMQAGADVLAGRPLARFQKYMGTRVDPFLINPSEGKGHRFVSLPPVCVQFPSHSEAQVAPSLALYQRSLNINVPELKAHDDLAGAAESDCQMFLLMCKGDC